MSHMFSIEQETMDLSRLTESEFLEELQSSLFKASTLFCVFLEQMQTVSMGESPLS